MAGGHLSFYKLGDGFGDEDLKKCAPSGKYSGGFGGGGSASEAWMFDGVDWQPLPSMSVVRNSPMCSLVQMDDGEVS
jgi:hypothetical protein